MAVLKTTVLSNCQGQGVQAELGKQSGHQLSFDQGSHHERGGLARGDGFPSHTSGQVPPTRVQCPPNKKIPQSIYKKESTAGYEHCPVYIYFPVNLGGCCPFVPTYPSVCNCIVHYFGGFVAT